jgi:hypothetical protein
MSVVFIMDFLEAAALMSVCLGKTEMIILLRFRETYIHYDKGFLKLFGTCIRYPNEMSIYLK